MALCEYPLATIGPGRPSHRLIPPTASNLRHSWLSAALLGVLCTGLAFVMYYRLIARIGAGRAVTVTNLVPLFGVAWAWLLLGEPLTLTMGIAGALILGSIALSQRAAK